MELLNKIFNSKPNNKVLELLDLNLEDTKHYKFGEDAGSGFDSGSQTFFNNYGALIPNESKASLSIYNLLVNPNNGEIYAFQWGMFTFLLKCDFDKLNIEKSSSRLKSVTMDGEVDFTNLGDNWSIVDVNFESEEKEHFFNAYKLSVQKEN